MKVEVGKKPVDVICEIHHESKLCQTALILANEETIDVSTSEKLPECFHHIALQLVALGDVIDITESSRKDYPMLLEAHLKLAKQGVVLRRSYRRTQANG